MARTQRCAFLLAIVCMAGGPRAAADVFDVADGDVAGLIAAITASNDNIVADTINLAAGGTYVLTAVNNTAQGATGLPAVTSAITLNGNGATIERSTAAGTPEFRILRIGGAGNLTLNRVTLQNGIAPASSPSNQGGALYVNGGTATLNRCALAGHSAVRGGAIGQLNGNLTLNNCTVSGSSAQEGGGIYSDGRVTLNYSTVAANSATVHSGGIAASGVDVNHTATFNSSLVATNTAPATPDVGIITTVTSAGFNLIGVGEGTPGWGATDLVGTNAAPLDPLLGPLHDNGGATLTHELLADSPAIDAIAQNTNGCGTTVTLDQRGEARPFGDGCDIGAFEAQIVIAAPTAACQDVVVEAGKSCTAAVSPDMVDNGSTVDPACEPATLNLDPAGPYPLGQTLVTLFVTDTCDQTATCTATITVVDATAPAISCPADIVARPTMPAGAVVNFSVSAIDACDAAPAVACSTSSGSTLPIGSTTTVQCTATDASSNSASCSFTIHVQTAAEATQSIIGAVADLVSAGKITPAEAKPLVVTLQAAVAAFESGDNAGGCSALQAFIVAVNALVSAGSLEPQQAEPLITAAQDIINAVCMGDEPPPPCDDDEDDGGDCDDDGGDDDDDGGNDDDDDGGSGDDDDDHGDDDDDDGDDDDDDRRSRVMPSSIDSAALCGVTGVAAAALPLSMLALARRARRRA